MSHSQNPCMPLVGIGSGSLDMDVIDQAYLPGEWSPSDRSRLSGQCSLLVVDRVWNRSPTATTAPIGRRYGHDSKPPRSSSPALSRSTSKAPNCATSPIRHGQVFPAWMATWPRNLVSNDLVSMCFTPMAISDAHG